MTVSVTAGAAVAVPLVDLRAQTAAVRADLDRAVGEVLDSAGFVLGPAVAAFEADFAAYTGRAFCVGVDSGTSALHLALLAAGVGPGDEVVTTPHTWISTSWAISYCGARPVFADVDPATGTLDPAAAERAVSARTRALLAVDLYGHPADLDRLQAVADRHGLALVEDAAQAHGARLGGRPAGSFGRLACFSFYPGKNLGAAGEAGAVVTEDPALAARVRRLRDHAHERRHHHVELGYNARRDGVQGAVLGVKLRHLDAGNDARRAAAARYGELLADLPGVVAPAVAPGADPCWHLYVVRVEDRDGVAARMADRGVATGVHYPVPVHLQPAYAALGHAPGDFPQAERFARTCLSLPMFPGITTGQQRTVAEALRAALDVRR